VCRSTLVDDGSMRAKGRAKKTVPMYYLRCRQQRRHTAGYSRSHAVDEINRTDGLRVRRGHYYQFVAKRLSGRLNRIHGVAVTELHALARHSPNSTRISHAHRNSLIACLRSMASALSLVEAPYGLAWSPPVQSMQLCRRYENYELFARRSSIRLPVVLRRIDV